jgi:hypothetical protein
VFDSICKPLNLLNISFFCNFRAKKAVFKCDKAKIRVVKKNEKKHHICHFGCHRLLYVVFLGKIKNITGGGMGQIDLTTAESRGYPVFTLESGQANLGSVPIERTATLEGSRDDAVIYNPGYRDIFGQFSATGRMNATQQAQIKEIFENQYLCRVFDPVVGSRQGYITQYTPDPTGVSIEFSVTGG